MCDSECPYDLILGQTSMAQLSAWQDYAAHKLYLQQISIPLTVKNNICILPLAYEKLIHPTEMPCITTCTERPIDDTNKSTPDDKYPWLDPDDIRRNMTDKEIL